MLKSSSKFYRKSGRQSETKSGSGSAEEQAGTAGKLWPRFELRFFAVLALSLVFYFIAGNIGSGWIYLLCASMLAALLLAVTAPLCQVLAVTVHQYAPCQFVAGQQASIVLKLKRTKLPLPVKWLRLSYQFDREQQTLSSKCAKVVESLEHELDVSWTTEPLKRGLHPLGTATLSCCFPIGLLWWQRSFRSPGKTITVYPKPTRIDGYFLYRLQPSTAAAGGPSRGRQSARQSNYTRGIREYVRGDSPRIVHWASSARTGRLLVREFETEGMPQFDVLLDLSAHWKTPAQFELAVTTACSLLSLGHRLGIGPKLFTNPALDTVADNLPAIPDGIELQMEILARVNPVKSVAGQIPELHRQDKTEHALVVIRPEDDEQTGNPNCYLIEIGQTVLAPGDKGTVAPASHRREKGPLRTVVSSEEDIAFL
jgi:hypothetical protein